MSRRSEVLDRIVLDRGAAITVWQASWAPQGRLERLADMAGALTYHYRRMAVYALTGRN